MGRKRRTIEISQDEAFRNLDKEYRENVEKDLCVEALNRIPADDRSLMILYVVCGNNKTKLAKILDCSWPFAHNRITEIQAKILQEIKKIKEENEDLF